MAPSFNKYIFFNHLKLWIVTYIIIICKFRMFETAYFEKMKNNTPYGIMLKL